MKIEHTTYDTTRRRRSMARRASDASIRIKNFFSTQFSRLADSKDSHPGTSERPATAWPRYGADISDPIKGSELTAYMTEQYLVDKSARRDERLIISANSSGRYLPLKDTDSAPVADISRSPTLRRKAKFVKENGYIKSTDSQARPRTADDKIQMDKLKSLRQAMKEGRLEQVIPPRQPSRTDLQQAPPRNRLADPQSGPSSEFSRGRSSSRHATPSHTHQVSQHRRKKSSTRVKDYIRTSTDYLEEKRKEVQNKFKAPFEHLNYASFPPSRRSSVSSDESFYCVGEQKQGQKSNAQAIHELKSRQQGASNERRLSGSGASPWAHHAPDNCRLCQTFGATGVQGLCQKCETDFHRRKTQEQNSDSEYEDDFRPTPPLKDAKILSMRRQNTQRYFQVETESLEDVRASVALKDIASRPIFNPVPVRQFSHKAVVVDDDDLGRTETQKMVERWSSRYEENEAPYVEELDTAPLLRRKAKGLQKGSSRDTEFYGFYDEVLAGR